MFQTSHSLLFQYRNDRFTNACPCSQGIHVLVSHLERREVKHLGFADTPDNSLTDKGLERGTEIARMEDNYNQPQFPKSDLKIAYLVETSELALHSLEWRVKEESGNGFSQASDVWAQLRCPSCKSDGRCKLSVTGWTVHVVLQSNSAMELSVPQLTCASSTGRKKFSVFDIWDQVLKACNAREVFVQPDIIVLTEDIIITRQAFRYGLKIEDRMFTTQHCHIQHNPFFPAGLCSIILWRMWTSQIWLNSGNRDIVHTCSNGLKPHSVVVC
jgi:hypothetical protein